MYQLTKEQKQSNVEELISSKKKKVKNLEKEISNLEKKLEKIKNPEKLQDPELTIQGLNFNFKEEEDQLRLRE